MALIEEPSHRLAPQANIATQVGRGPPAKHSEASIAIQGERVKFTKYVLRINEKLYL